MEVSIKCDDTREIMKHINVIENLADKLSKDISMKKLHTYTKEYVDFVTNTEDLTPKDLSQYFAKISDNKKEVVSRLKEGSLSLSLRGFFQEMISEIFVNTKRFYLTVEDGTVSFLLNNDFCCKDFKSFLPKEYKVHNCKTSKSPDNCSVLYECYDNDSLSLFRNMQEEYNKMIEDDLVLFSKIQSLGFNESNEFLCYRGVPKIEGGE